MAVEVERNEAFPKVESRRPISPGAEQWLGVKQQVLDHGFVYLVDYMGNDQSVVQAARVSYGAGTKQVNKDEGLIRYLMRHQHSTPFEMAEMKWHVKMPIFVARQWVRHRTASINEISARYSILNNEFYIPDSEHLAVQSTENRQGRGRVLDKNQAETVRALLIEESTRSYLDYEYLLNEGEDGKPKDPSRDMLARELSRMRLSLNAYTEWYWKANLHNTLRFLGLRKDPGAQYEIRVFADAMGSVVGDSFPITWNAYTDYALESKNFSRPELQALGLLLQGANIRFSEDQFNEAASQVGLKNSRELKEWKLKMQQMGISL